MRQLLFVAQTGWLGWWPVVPVVLWLGAVVALSQQSLLVAFGLGVVMAGLVGWTMRSSRIGGMSLLIAVGLPYGFEGVRLVEDRWHDLPPNGVIQGVEYTWGHVVANNSLGFREREVVVPKPADEFRIMVLGDSITWGAGVAMSDRYTDVLEWLLRDGRRGRSVVYNFALPGGRTPGQVEVLDEFVSVVEPDLVVVGFNENDAEPARRRDRRRELIAAWWGPGERWLTRFRLPRLAGATGAAIERAAELVRVVESHSDVVAEVYDPASLAWRDFGEALGAIKRVSDERRLPPPVFVVLNIGLYKDRPTSFRAPEEALRLIWQRNDQAEELAASLGYVTVNNVAAVARDLEGEVLAVNRFDLHPTAALHAVYARTLFEVIGSRYVVERGL